MKEEFNLSEKIQDHGNGITRYYCDKDVKEFIRLLKKNMKWDFENPEGYSLNMLYERIDKLAGEKLCQT